MAPHEGGSGEEMWQLMSRSYGPTKTLAAALDDGAREALRRDFAAFFEEHRDGRIVSLPREYLLARGVRRP